MTNKPLVSIIIPVYNAEKYIAETIECALAQTWPNKEIIVVDDGSIDGSLSIAKKHESDRVKVFAQENRGASAARNKGILEATGEYIQFLDADDLLSPDKIEVQINLLTGKPFAISNCAIVHFFDQNNPYHLQPTHEWYETGSTDSIDFLIKLYGGDLIGPTFGGMITNHAWLCPKNVIDKAGYWNEELSVDDDGEFFCRVVLASNQIVYSSAAVCYYRKYVTNTSSLSARNDLIAAKSVLQSTDLKAKHLLSVSTNSNVKFVLSRLYQENAFSFYPKYKSLSLEAESKAKALMPDFRYISYRGIKNRISEIIGWKPIRYMQYLKNLYS